MVVYFPLAIWKSDLASEVQPLTLLKSYLKKSIMKLFKRPSSDRIGNLIITIFTAIVSTFFMQSCMSLV